MTREVKERLELACAETRERIEQTRLDIVRAMAATGGAAGLSWDSPIIRTHRARHAAANADLVILEALLNGAR